MRVIRRRTGARPKPFIVRRCSGVQDAAAVTLGSARLEFPSPDAPLSAILSLVSAAPQPVRISEEEYLKTVYRPDCDYVDGEVLERNLGTFDHVCHLGVGQVFSED
jgi:hypothetical protein